MFTRKNSVADQFNAAVDTLGTGTQFTEEGTRKERLTRREVECGLDLARPDVILKGMSAKQRKEHFQRYYNAPVAAYLNVSVVRSSGQISPLNDMAAPVTIALKLEGSKLQRMMLAAGLENTDAEFKLIGKLHFIEEAEALEEVDDSDGFA